MINEEPKNLQIKEEIDQANDFVKELESVIENFRFLMKIWNYLLVVLCFSIFILFLVTLVQNL